MLRRFPALGALLALSLLAACAGPVSDEAAIPADSTTASWQEAPPPVPPEQTADIPFDGPLADGVYWGEIVLVQGSGDLAFVLSKARFGAFCHQWAAAHTMGEECLNDYYVETSSPAVAAADTDTVLTLADLADPGRSYEVDTETVESLLSGNPSPVPGFEWTPFPFLLTIASGRVLRAEQLWVP